MDCVAQVLAKHDFSITVKSRHHLTMTDTRIAEKGEVGVGTKVLEKD